MKIHQPGELIEDANAALQMLKDGNERFLKGALIDKSTYAADREILKDGQKPFAMILACSDSRVSPEIFFDQKLGDLFVIRIAGNVVDPAILGSIEFAAQSFKTRLVVVCGHSKCGAIKAACSGGDFPPNIQHLAEFIKPAVAKGGDTETVMQHNVGVMVERIKADEVVANLGVTVAGAWYDIHTGVVTWL